MAKLSVIGEDRKHRRVVGLTGRLLQDVTVLDLQRLSRVLRDVLPESSHPVRLTATPL